MLIIIYDTHINVLRMRGLAGSAYGCQNSTRISNFSVRNASRELNTQNIQPNRVDQCGLFLGPWQFQHIEYAGPFYGSMWLNWINAYITYGKAKQVS